MKQLKGKIIFGKYKVIEFISKGTFGAIFQAKNIKTEKLYALKAENKYSKNPILQNESFILFNLKGLGIPSVIAYGYFGQYNILIQTLLGKSIERIRLENNKKLNLKDVCMIAIQTLERIEFIHSKNYIHRDIKPANFLIGNPDSYLIYLIDFGNARKYRSSRTGKHITNDKKNKIFGTALFLSINVLKGHEQSRKDDLESLGYMYIYLATGYLPWSNIKYKNPEEMLDKISHLKQKTSLEELCKDMPKEMLIYMKYVRDLKFNQKPDYIFIRKLFMLILFKNGLKNDNLFSWVKHKITIKISQNQIRPRSNPQKRLMKKLVDSHSKKLIENKSSYDNQKNSNLLNDNEKQTHNNIIPINQALISIKSKEKINDKKLINEQIKFKNNNINKVDNTKEGNKDKRKDNNKEKSAISINRNNVYKSEINDFIEIKNNNKKYQKRPIKNMVFKKPNFVDNITLNINNSNPIYFINNTQSNSESNANVNNKYHKKFSNNNILYNPDYKDIDINGVSAYNNNSKKLSKISLKQYFPKYNTINRNFNNDNNRTKKYNSPIVQYIYKQKQNKKLNTNNEIHKERVSKIQELKFPFMGKNINNIIKSGSSNNNKIKYLKKPYYYIIKKNQKNELNNNKNPIMNFDTEMRQNTEKLYKRIFERKKILQVNMEANPKYISFNKYNQDKKLKSSLYDNYSQIIYK